MFAPRYFLCLGSFPSENNNNSIFSLPYAMFCTTVPKQVLDFMDTIFIVMKKSWRQLSFLHVYHHCTIFLVGRFCRTLAHAPSTHRLEWLLSYGGKM